MISAPGERLRGGAWWWLALALAVFGAALRVQLAWDDPGFDHRSPRGMLRSDPAELHYLARRLHQPADAPPPLRADPRVAWPETVDVLREYTVGQEWLVGSAQRLVPDAPLHVVALVVNSTTAALAVLAVFGLALELLVSRRAAALAALTFVALPAAYRTVGFVWVREDLALPLLAFAAWAAAAASRSAASTTAAVAGVLAALAAGTWHGASVGLTALASALVVGFGVSLVRARPANALEVDASERSSRRRRALVVGSLGFIAVTVFIPAARAKGVPLSSAVTLPLAAAVATGARSVPRAARWALGAGVIIGGALLRRALVGEDLAHVGALLLAKLEHAGTLPEDPARVSPDVRLMWQGPFASVGFGGAVHLFGLPLIPVLIWSAATLARARHHATARSVALAWAALLTLALTALATRASAFGSLAAPVAFAASAQSMTRFGARGLGRVAAVSLLAVQVLLFLGWASRYELDWNRPLAALAERRAMVEAVARLVPPGEPVLTDFLNGPALLADHDRPIVLQAKWETARARARVHRFLDLVYHRSAEDLAAYMRDEVQCGWLVLDRRWLVGLEDLRYAAGLRRDADPLRTGVALTQLSAPELAAGSPFEIVLDIPVGDGAPGAGLAVRLLRLTAAGSPASSPR